MLVEEGDFTWFQEDKNDGVLSFSRDVVAARGQCQQGKLPQ
jgi:hypothetical protein